ncbi:PREDICTED: nuclear factor 7, brain-like [Cyprinodon variegatus]|uniref:nuclear factor 7, brain-like n=1 Tax=Cyprinodon variegatus TaxID=28743 RepID=UPI00074265F2|nr:PREDICTED: nuclear factor 7, brain-like [Cyprinodon variegatus]
MNKDEGTELKTILKQNKRVQLMLNDEGSNTTQSSSIGAVRWKVTDESVQPHSSAPTVHAKTGTNRNPQHLARQGNLKELRSLQECVEFIHHWKEQVDQVCKGGTDTGEGTSKAETKSSDRRTERSLEESRKLILEWADELRHVDKFLMETPWKSDHQKKEEPKDEGQVRLMEWAKELQRATESCGVESEELGKVLRMLGVKKKRLFKLLPLLEFITWSLLKDDSSTMVCQIWLLAKQRTWKAGIPRYIPNTVWSWICSAAADVLLDPMTNHPWLQLSDDQRRVQEGLTESDPPYSSQRFDSCPCVLGSEGYSYGRHYWEVDIANKGYWRVGLTTADSKRKGNFPMTPKKGYWVLWRSTNHFYACTKPETELPISLLPRRLGVYLDYEEGQVSFYNVETKSHIFTFTANFRDKVYPLFAPMDGRTLITIINPNEISESTEKSTGKARKVAFNDGNTL